MVGGSSAGRTGVEMSMAEERKRVAPESKEVRIGETCGETLLTPEVQFAIARGLRQAYGAVLEAPVPDRFARLLAALGRAEKDL